MPYRITHSFALCELLHLLFGVAHTESSRTALGGTHQPTVQPLRSSSSSRLGGGGYPNCGGREGEAWGGNADVAWRRLGSLIR
jgi:hypothetical protein